MHSGRGHKTGEEQWFMGVPTGTFAFVFDLSIFTFVPRPSIRDPWPLDVSSLEHTLAPTPPPLPSGSCFCFFSQIFLVRCSAATSRCPPIRDRQDEGSTPSSWCRVQATDLTRVKATGSSSPRSPSCTQPSDRGFLEKNMKKRTPKSQNLQPEQCSKSQSHVANSNATCNMCSRLFGTSLRT